MAYGNCFYSSGRWLTLTGFGTDTDAVAEVDTDADAARTVDATGLGKYMSCRGSLSRM